MKYDGSAVISPDGVYRWHLWRVVNEQGTGNIGWVMLNPSTADAQKDDATIRRCIQYSRAWGYRRMDVVNLFSYRATDPTQLLQAKDPVGPKTDDWIRVIAMQSARLVLAWGKVSPALAKRSGEVLDLVKMNPLSCLGRNKDGSPKHPLYLPKDAQLKAWKDRQ